ncbi:hypothetical protein ACROYT_G044183 [Oculina patagonica]
MSVLMGQPAGAVRVKRSQDGFFYKTVILLKKNDCQRSKGKVYIPNTIEMAKIKKPNTGQYKTKVQFSKEMSEEMVRQKLQETFSTFNLNGRIFCAAVSQDSITFQFYGTPCIWDGKTIRERLKGNSVLYIVMEDDQRPLLDESGMVMVIDESQQGTGTCIGGHLAVHYLTATSGSSTCTDMCPGKSINSVHQTNEQLNSMNGNVPFLDGAQALSNEQTALYKDIAEMSLNVESVMEVDDSQQVLLGDSILSRMSFSDGNVAMSAQSNRPLHSQVHNALPRPGTSTNITDLVPQNPVQMMSDSSGEDNSSSDIVTTSGISEYDFDCSPDDMLPNQWKPDVVQFKVSRVTPERVSLKGGNVCCFTLNQTLPKNVQSGFAMFGHLGTVDLKRCGDDSLVGMRIPPAQNPGWVTVILKSQFGIPLGEIKILYVDEEKEFLLRIVSEPRLQCELMRELEVNANRAGGSETQNSENLGFTQQVRMLQLLVYAAAESGSQQFIKMIFTSSAARMVFNSYKHRPLLPEVIAKNNGNEETANYLEEVTKRFSEELEIEKECSQTIDWSELVRAADAAHKQHADVTVHQEIYQIEKDVPKETGYLGDVDTSSSESSEPQSSDSEDDIPTTAQKETEADKWKQPDQVLKDTIKANKASLSQTPISFFKDGNLQAKQVIVKIKPFNWEQNLLHLIEDHLVQEAQGLRRLKCLYRSGISFLLGLGQEPVQLHLITTHERLGILLKLTKERNKYCEMHTNTAEIRQSLEHSSTVVGDNDDRKLSSMDSLLQLYCRPFDKDSFKGPEIQKDCFPEFATTLNDEDLIERTNSPEFLTEHCYFTAHDVWMLTFAFRPRRKILFVYVADRRDVLPYESSFHDGEYELSTQCWQRTRCQNNLVEVGKRLKDMHELSELKKSQLDPPPLTPHVTFITEVACKEQSHPIDGQPYDLVGQPYHLVGKQCSKYFSADRKFKHVKRNNIDPPGDLQEGLYSSVIQNGNACEATSANELFTTSHENKVVLEGNNEIDERVCKRHLSTQKFDNVGPANDDNEDEKDNASICQPTDACCVHSPEMHYCKMAKKCDFEDVSTNHKDDYDAKTIKKLLDGELSYDLRSPCQPKKVSQVTKTVDVPYREDTTVLSLKECCDDLNKGTKEGTTELQELEDQRNDVDNDLANKTSLTTLTLTINRSIFWMFKDWAKDLRGLAKNTLLTTLNLIINNSRGYGMSGNWTKGLGDALAKTTSLTTLTLTINNSSDHGMSGNWTAGLGDGLAENTSLTTLSLTINNSSGHGMSGDWAKGLGDGLAKNTSLTTLTLTINDSSDYGMSGNWTAGLGDGLAENTSLTTLNLTINDSSDHGMSGNWTAGLGDGLAKNTSLTTLTLTINDSSHFGMSGNWTKGLGDGLAKNTSLTTLTLTINDSSDYGMSGNWTAGLGDGLAKNTSLTTLSLTINASSDYGMSENWTAGLGDGLAKNTSLTTLNLTMNNSSDHGMSGDWTKGLGDGLAKNTPLTTLTLTINDSSQYGMSGNWAKGLVGDGLAKNTSLTTLNLTINDSSDYGMSGNWTAGLGDGLAKNTSLTTLNLTINDSSDYGISGTWAEDLGDGLAKNTSLTTLTLTINDSSDYGISGTWAEDLGDGLAKNTSLTALTLTINNSSDYRMSGNWTAGLCDGLAKNTSLTSLTLNNQQQQLPWNEWKGSGRGTSLTAPTRAISNTSSICKRWARDTGDGLDDYSERIWAETENLTGNCEGKRTDSKRRSIMTISEI